MALVGDEVAVRRMGALPAVGGNPGLLAGQLNPATGAMFGPPVTPGPQRAGRNQKGRAEARPH